MKHIKNFNEKLKNIQINEGFSDFTIIDSDMASGTMSDVEKAIVKELKKQELEKGSSYNTHGTLNVAMILVERLKKAVENGYELRGYASKVAEKLQKEADKFKKSRDYEKNYINACEEIAKKLAKISRY